MTSVLARGRYTSIMLDEKDRDTLTKTGALEIMWRGHTFKLTSPILSQSQSDDDSDDARIKLVLEKYAAMLAEAEEKAKVEVERCKSQIGVLDHEIKVLEKEKADLHDEIDTLQDDKSRLGEKIEGLEIEIADLETLLKGEDTEEP